MASGRFVGTNELRRPDALIHDLESNGGTYYITQDGKAKAVLMDVHRYNALMDLLEESELLPEHVPETRHHASIRRILRSTASNRMERKGPVARHA